MRGWMKLAALCAVAAVALVWSVAGQNGPSTRAESRAEKDNVTLLAQTVCGEARGESYEGKVAVAAVILNRTLDDRFPDSVAGVVYQTHAFEAVSRGEIYRDTTDECYKAARAAVSGWDPSNGSIYFFAPAKTNNAFIWGRPQVRTIGEHIFAK